MKHSCWVWGLGLLAAVGQAQAASSVRAAVGGGSLEIDPDDDSKIKGDVVSGDFRAAVGVTDHVFLRGEYTLNSIDEVRYQGDDYDLDLDLNVLRLAAGYGGNTGSIRLYGAVEYLNLRLRIEDGGDSLSGHDDGFGLTGGIGDQGQGSLLWNAELSLLRVDGTGGASFDGTLGYRFTPAFAGFAGLQSYGFSDNDVDLGFGSLYLGFQYRFL